MLGPLRTPSFRIAVSSRTIRDRVQPVPTSRPLVACTTIWSASTTAPSSRITRRAAVEGTTASTRRAPRTACGQIVGGFDAVGECDRARVPPVRPVLADLAHRLAVAHPEAHAPSGQRTELRQRGAPAPPPSTATSSGHQLTGGCPCGPAAQGTGSSPDRSRRADSGSSTPAPGCRCEFVRPGAPAARADDRGRGPVRRRHDARRVDTQAGGELELARLPLRRSTPSSCSTRSASSAASSPSVTRRERRTR